MGDDGRAAHRAAPAAAVDGVAGGPRPADRHLRPRRGQPLDRRAAVGAAGGAGRRAGPRCTRWTSRYGCWAIERGGRRRRRHRAVQAAAQRGGRGRGRLAPAPGLLGPRLRHRGGPGGHRARASTPALPEVYAVVRPGNERVDGGLPAAGHGAAGPDPALVRRRTGGVPADGARRRRRRDPGGVSGPRRAGPRAARRARAGAVA